jgi:hypothetical protein
MENTGRRGMLKQLSSKFLGGQTGNPPTNFPTDPYSWNVSAPPVQSPSLEGVESFQNTLIETAVVDGCVLKDIVSLAGRVSFSGYLECSDTGTDRH